MNDKSFEYKGIIYTTGDKVKCIIKCECILDAKIYVLSEKNKIDDSCSINMIAFDICQNVINENCADYKELDSLGYRYSFACHIDGNDYLHSITELELIQKDELVGSIKNIIGKKPFDVPESMKKYYN